LETAERKDFHAFCVRFVGECVALVVAETPRKPTIEQVDVFTDIRRHHKAALLSLQQESRPDSMKGRIADATDRTRPRIDRVKSRDDGYVNLGIL
jgi:hypothetical protein